MIIINVTFRYVLHTRLQRANAVIIVNVTIRYVLPTRLQKESAMMIINVTFRYVLPTRLQRENAVIIVNVTIRYVLPMMMSSKPQELKQLDWSKVHRYAQHSHYKYRQRRGKKKARRKKCQVFASVMYSSYHAGLSPEGGLEVGQTLWFFAHKLIYSGAKWRLTMCTLKFNPRQEDFRTAARHIKCLFFKYAEKVVH